MNTGFLCKSVGVAMVVLAGLLSLSARPVDQRSVEEESEAGFQPIFNGRDLSGWIGDKTGKTVSDGVLEWRGGGHLWTEAEYCDFVLRFEFTLSPGANNGLAIRWPGAGDPAYTGMCELQILDNTAPEYADLDPRQYHGSAYGIAAAIRGHLRPPGEWNDQEVLVQGSRVRVELNGAVILDADLSTITDYMGDKPHPGKDRKSGHIGFAGHGEKHLLQFRDIRLRNLESD